MDELDFVVLRRLCIEFLAHEARSFDREFSSEELAAQFDAFRPYLNLEDRDDRLSLVMVLAASTIFAELFDSQGIKQFLAAPQAPGERRQLLHRALLQRANYDTVFLQRKSWLA